MVNLYRRVYTAGVPRVISDLRSTPKGVSRVNTKMNLIVKRFNTLIKQHQAHHHGHGGAADGSGGEEGAGSTGTEGTEGDEA